MEIVCLDLEGVLVPEIWINFAKKTGIKALEATTRDIPDYDLLMKQRLAILELYSQIRLRNFARAQIRFARYSGCDCRNGTIRRCL